MTVRELEEETAFRQVALALLAPPIPPDAAAAILQQVLCADQGDADPPPGPDEV